MSENPRKKFFLALTFGARLTFQLATWLIMRARKRDEIAANNCSITDLVLFKYLETLNRSHSHCINLRVIENLLVGLSAFISFTYMVLTREKIIKKSVFLVLLLSDRSESEETVGYPRPLTTRVNFLLLSFANEFSYKD